MGDSGPGVWCLIREDYETHGRSKVNAGLHALVVYRLGTAMHGSRRRFARLARPLYKLARAFVVNVYCIEFPLEARIGRRLLLPHAHGIVFVHGSVIGDDCLVRHNVTLGAGSHEHGGHPVVGNGVHFGPGSIVMGAVTIGDGVRIGPGAVVVEDVPAGMRVVSAKAVIRDPGMGAVVAPVVG